MRTYQEKIEEFKEALEAKEVVVTTDRGDQIIAYVTGYQNVVLNYNHAAQLVDVEEYKPGTLDRVLKTRPNYPLQYAKKLCEKYQKA